MFILNPAVWDTARCNIALIPNAAVIEGDSEGDKLLPQLLSRISVSVGWMKVWISPGSQIKFSKKKKKKKIIIILIIINKIIIMIIKKTFQMSQKSFNPKVRRLSSFGCVCIESVKQRE